MKQGVIAFAVTCLLIMLAGCDNSPEAKQARANRMVARNEMFMKCVETATRTTNQYHDNSEVVNKCREAAQMLI